MALTALLHAGDNVLVHCRGGLGRAGMIAARLLVEEGVEPDVAMKNVRAARPGAIETRAQEQWVRLGRKASGRRHQVSGRPRRSDPIYDGLNVQLVTESKE